MVTIFSDRAISEAGRGGQVNFGRSQFNPNLINEINTLTHLRLTRLTLHEKYPLARNILDDNRKMQKLVDVLTSARDAAIESEKDAPADKLGMLGDALKTARSAHWKLASEDLEPIAQFLGILAAAKDSKSMRGDTFRYIVEENRNTDNTTGIVCEIRQVLAEITKARNSLSEKTLGDLRCIKGEY